MPDGDVIDKARQSFVVYKYVKNESGPIYSENEPGLCFSSLVSLPLDSHHFITVVVQATVGPPWGMPAAST